MATRFTFPPVNLGAPVEPQLVHRAEWVGYKLSRCDDSKGLRWRLTRGQQVFTFDSLVEIDLKLSALLEAIGERIERDEHARLVAERRAEREARDRLVLAS